VAANDAFVYVIKGCMAPAAGNFDSLATTSRSGV
jgi:hypothetical protein